MLEEIVENNLVRVAEDLEEIPGIVKIDFMDIFPKSEEHRNALDNELMTRAVILQETERGNIYKLKRAIMTRYGSLEYVKIRFFDETRLHWEAAADFEVEDRRILLDRVNGDERFSYIERPDWNAVEFRTNDSLVYFLEPLASEVYDKKGGKC